MKEIPMFIFKNGFPSPNFETAKNIIFVDIMKIKFMAINRISCMENSYLSLNNKTSNNRAVISAMIAPTK